MLYELKGMMGMVELEEKAIDENKKSWYKKWWVIILVVIGALIIIAIVINPDTKKGFDNGYSKTKSNNTAKPANLSSEKFTNDNFTEVLSNADAHKGAAVDITGQVFANPSKDKNVWQFQIYTNPKKIEGNTIIIGGADFEIKNDDFVRIRGTVEKKIDYKSTMGADMSAPLIMTNNIQKVPAQDVLSPTQHSIDVNQSQDQHGIIITIQKIEFANEETRFYINVKNHTNSKANVYSFSMKVTQGTSQYDEQNNYKANYPKLQSDLLPGIETSGIVAFPALDYNAKSLKFNAEASSDNYNINFNPYIFVVNWQ